MHITICIKKMLSEFFFRAGIVDKKFQQYGNRGYYLILMYHRIIRKSRLVQAGMYVKPETFEKHLIFIDKYFNVAPIDFLANNFDLGLTNNKGKPTCVLTFDDGWIDFYDNAFPLLKKHRKHATVFLPTDYIDSCKLFWTDEFAHLLYNKNMTLFAELSDKKNISILKHIDEIKGSFEHKLEAGIQFLKKFSSIQIESILNGLSEIWQIERNHSSRSFLSWEEIDEMKNSGLISFGSHTANHQILTTIDTEEIVNELTFSRNKLINKNAFCRSSVPFCYPNGNYTKTIADMVKESGYNIAVTTKNGWNHINDGHFTLKRVGIHEDMTSNTSLFASRVAGLI